MPVEAPIEILFVEDDDDDYFLSLKSLARDRVMVNTHRVEDGVAAMDFLRRAPPYEYAPRPDLILLDLNMPRMDGREVLKEVKSDPELKCIPVVVLTTSDDERDLIESYSRQANSVITKPVGLTQFRECLATLKKYWFTVVKLPGR
ncbi:Response regulator rcp1 [Posidoniimonas polymericola]|uniref:Response regulator rcp1 n=1 Tax=Posidoniimonas polymericola TaxID=2528002 RepID=A0A5C5YGK3_9BACT|nr:response regulator [Posidoniimonas polymericola]TWT74520.1 Response regulator rcp1 [Posidoniimonas polymericola]